MRYRKLTRDGDYSFGRSQGDFLVDSPDAVGQAVLTRLRLETGEWFLDASEGTPYQELILGASKQTTYDLAIKQRILDTPGVLEITKYSSYVNTTAQAVKVVVTITTKYGQSVVTA